MFLLWCDFSIVNKDYEEMNWLVCFICNSMTFKYLFIGSLNYTSLQSPSETLLHFNNKTPILEKLEAIAVLIPAIFPQTR